MKKKEITTQVESDIRYDINNKDLDTIIDYFNSLKSKHSEYHTLMLETQLIYDYGDTTTEISINGIRTETDEEYKKRTEINKRKLESKKKREVIYKKKKEENDLKKYLELKKKFEKE